MRCDVVLVGAGGHASDVLGLVEDLRREGMDLHVPGLLADEKPEMKRFAGRGVQLLGDIATLAERPPTWHYVVAVGYPTTRRVVAERLGGLPHRAMSLVHPRATVGTGFTMGDGGVLLSGVSISPSVTLGRHVYVSHLVGIGHDTVIGDYCSLMPGALVSGDVQLGRGVLVGAGAVVLEGIKIGAGAVLAAGCVVTRDVLAGVTVRGIPARA
ncbi:MAG: acetyltransferase [Flavobacterium sp.]|nr:acetyltransferase [Aeromicrobium sp.]